VEFRVEKAGVVQAGVGKASFSEDAIVQNVKTFVDSVIKARPQGAKGNLCKKGFHQLDDGPGREDRASVHRCRERGGLNTNFPHPELVEG